MMAEFLRWDVESPFGRDKSPEVMLQRFCEWLVAHGIPLRRSSTSLMTMHPEIRNREFEWWRESGAVARERPHTVIHTAAFVGSPIEEVFRTRAALCCKLDDAQVLARFPQLVALADKGCTEYLALPVELSDGRMNGITFATDHPGGFTDAHRQVLEVLRPAVAARLDLGSMQFALSSLLRVYLGPNAAKRVLQGKFQRGQGESIRAAIWYCDMRGFTELTDAWPATEVVALLDRYFEAVGGAVEGHGGEILKFVGDAVLAVFPVGEQGPRGPCGQALAAARSAREELARLNAGGLAERRPALAMGIALHLGEVLYGNIGARQRLDFTIIGRAVNEAARIEGLCKELGVPLLMSADFAHAAGLDDAVSLGVRTLRGVRAPLEVVTLGELAPGGAPAN